MYSNEGAHRETEKKKKKAGVGTVSERIRDQR